MPDDTSPTRGYTATRDQLLTRLRRVEGQVRGIEKLVDESVVGAAGARGTR